MTAVITQQSTLRSFIVYDCAPVGCIPFLVTDDAAAPLLRPGDLAMIDTTDRHPAAGELFVIEWGRGTVGCRRHLVEMWKHSICLSGLGSSDEVRTDAWSVGAYNRPKSHQEAVSWLKAGRSRLFVDGPYAAEGPKAWYLPSILIGRVVGILEPGFSELRRLPHPEDC